MIFHKLGLIHKNQRGVALIELLLAFLITGVITGGITMTIFQVFSENTRSTNHMIAVRQVQNAGYWLSRDTQMAQSVVITGVSGFPLTLTWTDWDSGDVYKVVYRLEDMTGGFKQLERQHLTYDADGNEVGNETTIVAQYINPNNTNCEFTGGSAFSLPDENDKFTITDAVGGDSGVISVTTGTVALTGTGAWGETSPLTGPATSTWATDTANETMIVTVDTGPVTGSWTVTTGTATAAIIADVVDVNATLTDGGELVLTITTTVGEASETRVYEVTPRPGS